MEREEAHKTGTRPYGPKTIRTQGYVVGAIVGESVTDKWLPSWLLPVNGSPSFNQSLATYA